MDVADVGVEAVHRRMQIGAAQRREQLHRQRRARQERGPAHVDDGQVGEPTGVKVALDDHVLTGHLCHSDLCGDGQVPGLRMTMPSVQ